MSLISINLKLFDIDGALFRDQADHIPEKWLISSNKQFLTEEISRINQEQYKLIILGYGTNRQSARIDFINKTRHGSCAPVLPLLQSYFASNLPTKVVLDPFLMADIYSSKPDKAAGDSYFALLNNLYNLETAKHDDWLFDQFKISLLYAHLHRIAILNPQADIVVDFYDDTFDILRALSIFFQNYTILLPPRICLRLHHYSGSSAAQFGKDITSNPDNILDERYDWSIRYLSYRYKIIKYVKIPQQKFAISPQSLQTLYSNNHLTAVSHTEMCLHPSNFCLQEFLDFRMRAKWSLKSNHLVTHTSNYVTAQDLNTTGLLPDRFIFPSPPSSLNSSFGSDNYSENESTSSKLDNLKLNSSQTEIKLTPARVKKVYEKIAKLKQHGQRLLAKDPAKANVVFDHVNGLEAQLTFYQQHNIQTVTHHQFRMLLTQSYKSMADHRHIYRVYLLNLIVAASIIGLGAIALKVSFTGSLFFIETKRQRKLNKVEKAFNQLTRPTVY